MYGEGHSLEGHSSHIPYNSWSFQMIPDNSIHVTVFVLFEDCLNDMLVLLLIYLFFLWMFVVSMFFELSGFCWILSWFVGFVMGLSQENRPSKYKGIIPWACGFNGGLMEYHQINDSMMRRVSLGLQIVHVFRHSW